MRLRLPLSVAAALLLGLTGCGGSSAGGTAASSAPSGGPATPTGTVTVFAAASLTDVFGELGKRLEAQDPGLTVRFNFAGSSGLAQQLVQGAPADVFASANEQQMEVVTDAGRTAAAPQDFTENVLEIAVPRGNPAGVTGLADFARDGLTLAVCAPQVPCGAAAQQVFQAAGVQARPDTQEQDVRAALTKVQLGEVDAALVYATDVRAAGDGVEGIPFPEAGKALTTYPIAVLEGAPNPAGAQAFVDLVRSPAGQQALADAGFRTPGS